MNVFEALKWPRLFFVISWNVAIFAFLPIPIIIWGSFLYQRKLEPRYAEVRTNAGRLNALLENDLSGMSTIQSFTAEEMEANRVEEVSNEYRNANKKAIRLSAAFVPLIDQAFVDIIHNEVYLWVLNSHGDSRQRSNVACADVDNIFERFYWRIHFKFKFAFILYSRN